MLLLGYDIGSSSIKASLLDAATGRLVASGSSPKTELAILANSRGGQSSTQRSGGSTSAWPPQRSGSKSARGSPM